MHIVMYLPHYHSTTSDLSHNASLASITWWSAVNNGIYASASRGEQSPKDKHYHHSHLLVQLPVI